MTGSELEPRTDPVGGVTLAPVITISHGGGVLVPNLCKNSKWLYLQTLNIINSQQMFENLLSAGSQREVVTSQQSLPSCDLPSTGCPWSTE